MFENSYFLVMMCTRLFGVALSVFLVVATVGASGVFSDDVCNMSLEEVESEIRRSMRLMHMPSFCVGVVQDGELSWSGFYGSVDGLFSGDAPDEHSVFLAGSVSKSVTAVALMQLWEQGLFDLDDDVNDYLPFSVRNPLFPDVPVTFRNLLSHSSSLANDQLSLFLYFSLLNYPPVLLGEFVEPGGSLFGNNVWFDYGPGDGSYYTSVGFEILGLLVEILSGEPYAQYCRNHILEPLGMVESGFSLDEIEVSSLVRPYIWLGIYLPIPIYENHNAASGGLMTTLADLSNFLWMHMNGGVVGGVRILEEESLELLHSVQFPELENPEFPIDPIKYGLGWMVHPETAWDMSFHAEGHSGTVPGGLTYMFFRNETGVIFFSNQCFQVGYYGASQYSYRMELLEVLLDFGDSFV